MRRPRSNIAEAMAAGCRQNDAFMLFLYRSKDGTEEETVWNSRDGVTPFFIPSRTGKEMQHVEYARDRFAPDHMPQVGDRIFVSTTREKALEYARRRVDHYWDREPSPMRDRYPSREAAIAKITEGIYGDGEQPDLVEVTPELLAQLHADRRSKRFPKAEQTCRSIGEAIGSALPDGYGFALVVFDHGDGGQMTYVSNGHRADVIKMLRELASKIEGDA